MLEDNVEEAKEMEWIDVNNRLPEFGKDVEITYNSGKNVGNGQYLEERKCMLAGIGGTNGYFGEGWATASCDDIDAGLIIDKPTHWRHKK